MSSPEPSLIQGWSERAPYNCTKYDLWSCYETDTRVPCFHSHSGEGKHAVNLPTFLPDLRHQ